MTVTVIAPRLWWTWKDRLVKQKQKVCEMVTCSVEAIRFCEFYTHTHTHTRLTALFPGLPGWAGTRKVKPIWILLKQETVSGSGISWAIYKSAPSSRQITTPVPHHSVFLQAGCCFCRPTNSVKALKVWVLDVCKTFCMSPSCCFSRFYVQVSICCFNSNVLKCAGFIFWDLHGQNPRSAWWLVFAVTVLSDWECL